MSSSKSLLLFISVFLSLIFSLSLPVNSVIEVEKPPQPLAPVGTLASPPSAPTVKPPSPPTAPLPPPVMPKDCPNLCDVRCGSHRRPKVCIRACRTCCLRCKCVPPGTYGNREKCGKCYISMTTHGGRPKCP
ncbi:putative gibberellin-regulated protein 14-like [Raphanus sativus]|uniref:Gibberellin-regulated protein 14 n=1 Tax=Raphanus sativus TaxID=3726 RepID=A0A6J0LB58_RAPSA|nr:gibberellin-regulated protein 14 [Raphanus sativus]KAJ4877857.1 putative gibberellin-regulated protein 14-like [Raphanus sativus]